MWSRFLGLRSGVADGSIIPDVTLRHGEFHVRSFEENLPVSNPEVEMSKKNVGEQAQA